MMIAISFFSAALVLLLVLFCFKYWELQREAVVAPVIRERLDRRALQLKGLLATAWGDLEKVPPAAVRLVKLVVHELALGFAALARALERGAHAVAEMVSHKHRFERRDTRSEFLKKVTENKRGAE